MEKIDNECGTTALVCILLGRRILTCSVGDCRAVLVKRDRTVLELSFDHTLEREDEQLRITSTSSGRVVPGTSNTLRLVPSESAYDLDTIKKKKLALGMSRSMGHPILSKFGCISEPDFTFVDVSDGDVLVIATDGVFGVLSNEEVGGIVLENLNPAKTSNLIVKTCTNFCEEDMTDADNTTALVVNFSELSPVVPASPSKRKEKEEISTKSPKKMKPEAPKSPKSPKTHETNHLTPFKLYCKEKREEIEKKMPNAKKSEVNKFLSESWKNESDEIQSKYNEMSKQEKQKFLQQKK